MGSSQNHILASLKDARERIESLERGHREPLAVVGIGCRFPGSGNDPERFWQMLCDGVDLLEKVPSNRWKADQFYDEDPRSPGKIYTQSGMFLHDLERFDSDFFKLSPREVERMDPQHRLLLETSWEALERSSLSMSRLASLQTGVYIGIGQSHHGGAELYGRNPKEINAHSGTGNLLCFAAGRVSHHLGLTGPCVSVDTACSSSLMALHLACQGLRHSECDVALVGGVHLLLDPRISIFLARTGALSADGRCKTLDANADGFGRGEGCGVVALRRLSDAQRDRDPILAVVQGSATNHDGKGSGFTVPNQRAQEAVIRAALRDGAVAPEEVSLVELHGTGTELGDPIEVNALASVYLENEGARNRELTLSAVKSNIGHLEAAAGIAGLIKVVLALQHKRIPRQTQFRDPNRLIDWDSLPIHVPKETVPWDVGEGEKKAGVSAFGMSGSNVHVVLSEAPVRAPIEARARSGILLISAKSSEALEQSIDRYRGLLSSSAEGIWEDICFSSIEGRTHFGERIAVVASSNEEARLRLEAFSKNEKRSLKGVSRGAAISPKVVWMFTGQGSQYHGMARELFDTQLIFRETLEYCDELLRPHLDRSLLEVLFDEDYKELLDQTAYTQPVLFSICYSLAKFWISLGIRPDAVIGHSVGEYVAATVAGVVTLEDGLRLIVERGKLMGRLPSGGAMAAIRAPRSDVGEMIEPYQDKVAIAAVNGPNATVISGREEAVIEIVERFNARRVLAQRLNVSHAFHSPMMEPIVAEFGQFAQQFNYGRPRIDMASNVTGSLVPADCDWPSYWERHIRASVEFSGGLQQLSDLGYNLFLEVGPKPTLVNMGRQCLPNAVWANSLDPARADREMILDALAHLYVHGFTFDGRLLYPDANWVSLPTYPFGGRSFRLMPPQETKQSDLKHFAPHGHPLRLPFSNEVRFERTYDLETPAYVSEHRVYGEYIVPAASHIGMLLSSLGGDEAVLEELAFVSPLWLKENLARRVQILSVPVDSVRSRFRLISQDVEGREEPDWLVHCSGIVKEGRPRNGGALPDLSEIRGRCGESVSPEQFYKTLEQANFTFGAAFRWNQEIHVGRGEILARLTEPVLPESLEPYPLYPGMLDSCFQLLSLFWERNELAYVPFSIGAVNFRQRPDQGAPIWCHAVADKTGATGGSLTLFHEGGEMIASVDRFQFREARKGKFLGGSDKRWTELVYEPHWIPIDPVRRPSDRERWMVVGKMSSTTGDAFGADTILVSPGDRFSQQSDGRFQINLAEPTDFDQLFDSIENFPAGVVFVPEVWNRDADPCQLSLRQCQALLNLLQSLSRRRARSSPRFVLLSRGARQLGNELPDPVQAAVWGLALAIEHEMAYLKPICLDLDPEGDSDVYGLSDVLNSPPGAVQQACRSRQRYALGLKQRPLVETQTLSLRADGAYLITGGLGGLGLVAAKTLIGCGARTVVLVSRGLRIPEEVTRLRENGVRLEVVACDVGDSESVSQLVGRFGDEFPPLRGIVHAAGGIDDGILLKLGESRLESVFRSKVVGTWNLHQSTQNTSLDFFISYSSTAAVMGSPGQGNYSAANSFMDALMMVRAGGELAASTVNWGAWQTVGMAAGTGARIEDGIEPDQGARILESLLVGGETLSAILPQSPGSGAIPDRGSQSKVSSEIVSRIRAASLEKRVKVLHEHIRTLVVAITGDSSFEAATGFFDLGFDSINALELKDQLERDLEIPLHPTLIFDYPSVEDLTEFLASELKLETVLPRSGKPVVEKPSNGDCSAVPIAIVGIGCRFPGGVNSPDEFWELLSDGEDAVSEIPSDRRRLGDFYDQNPDAPGKMNSRHGGFCRDIDKFDASFFNIAPREANRMDPQQRFLLEVSWEALEHANIDPKDLRGSATGVFIGVSTHDYAMLQLTQGKLEDIDAYYVSGSVASVAAGRLSHVLGLTGPSLVVDTACSSSLVALDLACKSLRQGECRQALAGGVGLILSPEFSVNFSKARMLSPSGRCHTFDSAADGYVRGEGCGVVVLKRLDDAIADGDRIVSVVRGSAVNQDGPGAGLTVPNGASQAAVMRQALESANLEPSSIGFVEAHGTGTPLGDPIEIRSIGEVYGAREIGRPLYLGSAKTNLGHLEAAAGIAGVIKAALSLYHCQIPASLHFKEPNANVDWSRYSMNVVQHKTPWPEEQGAFAAVNSFGFSGTNAHVILEKAPNAALSKRPSGIELLTFSAKDPDSLRRLGARYGALFGTIPDEDIRGVCSTSYRCRGHFDHRAVVLGKQALALSGELQAFADGRASAVITGKASSALCPVFRFVSGALGGDPRLVTELEEYSLELDRLRREIGLDHSTIEDSPDAKTDWIYSYALATLLQKIGIEGCRVEFEEGFAPVAAALAGMISVRDAAEMMEAHQAGDRQRFQERLERTPFADPLIEIDLLPDSDLWGASDITVKGGGEPAPVLEICAENCQLDWVLSVSAQFYLGGGRLDWSVFDRGEFDRQLNLPLYPFRRDLYWFTPSIGSASGSRGNGHEHWDCVQSNDHHWVFEGILDPATEGSLGDHLVAGKIVVSGAHFLSLILGAWRQHESQEGVRLGGLVFEQMMTLRSDLSRETQLEVDLRSPEHRLQFKSRESGSEDWDRHVRGNISASNSESPTIDLDSIRTRCEQIVRLDSDRVHPRARALDLGPRYQWIDSIGVGAGEAIAELRIPSECSMSDLCNLHPGMIDSCIRLLIWVLPELEGETLVPFYIDQLRLHRFPDGNGVWCHLVLVDYRKGRAVANLQLVDASGSVLVAIEGFETRAISPESQERENADGFDDWLYRPKWKQATDPASTSSCLKLVDSLSFSHLFDGSSELTRYGQAVDWLESEARVMIVDAFVELGAEGLIGRELTVSEIGRELGIAESYDRLLARLLLALQEIRGVESHGSKWRFSDRIRQVNSTETGEETRRLVGLEHELTMLCGQELPAVLCGRKDATEVLFPGGDLSVLSRLYNESATSSWMNGATAEVVRSVIADIPGGRKLRVLEVGGGTGGLTAQVLNLFDPMRVEYTFTDLSPQFLEAAKERFSEFSFLTFERLDIEANPQAQGFNGVQYDLVIAANVLHATRDLTETMKHIRTLLCPKGVLIALEAVEPRVWLDMTFGLTEGWWKFQDSAIRRDYPLLNLDAWRSVLSSSGFEEAVCHSVDGGSRLGQSVVVARRSSDLVQNKRTWLLFSDEENRAHSVSDYLRSQKQVVDYRDGHSVPTTYEGVANLLDELEGRDGFPDWIVLFNFLDAPVSEELGLDVLDRVTVDGCEVLLNLTRALISGSFKRMPSVVVVTRSAAGVSDQDRISGLACSPLIGLARVISIEHPEMQVRTIDLDIQHDGNEAARMIQTLIESAEESEIAMRNGSAWVRRLSRWRCEDKVRATFCDDGYYLITGGTGALGMSWARYVLANGGRHVRLLSRTKPNRETQAEIDRLCDAGGRVDWMPVDVGDADGMMQCLNSLSLPLKGIFHAAGSLHDDLIANHRRHHLESAMATKIRGAWILHLLTLDQPLEWFVMFSSAASLLGSAGQASHAAANAFLDALAAYRRSEGLPGLAINWGAWAGKGAAKAAHWEKDWRQRGFGTIDPAIGVSALSVLVGQPISQVGVVPIHWREFLDHRGWHPFFEEIDTRDPLLPVSSPGPASGDVVCSQAEFAQMSRERKYTYVGDLIRQETASVLGMSGRRVPDLEDRFFDLGMDSLTSLELRNRLQKTLNYSLPSSLLYDFSTLDELVNELTHRPLGK